MAIRSVHTAIRSLASLLVGLGLLTGCSDRPNAVGFVAKPQQRLQSAAHWQVVADDVASAVSTYLTDNTGRKDPVSVYMMRDDGTLFADAFLAALQTRFVDLGHPVAVDARPDVTAVGIDVLMVPHDPGIGQAKVAPGPLTALGTGVAVASLLLDKFPWGVTAGALGLGLDFARVKPTETDTEMVLTVSLARDGFFTFRSSAVYYVNSRDLRHYRPAGLGGELATLNDVPVAALAYDIAGKPYVVQRRRR